MRPTISSRHPFMHLRDSIPVVLPSMLQCDFGNLEREVARLEGAGVRALHLDVMDGCFVPNLTYGMPVVSALRRLTDMPLDVHLMIAHPERYLRQFQEAGADVITFHAEAVDDPRPVLAEIHKLGISAGLAINPATPVSAIEPCLPDCDLVLVMSVEAGFGGQSFQPVAIDKLKQLSGSSAGNYLLEVDGGINAATIAGCAAAGAALFVVGSAIFGSDDYRSVATELAQLAAK